VVLARDLGGRVVRNASRKLEATYGTSLGKFMIGTNEFLVKVF
jgi:hypothetical protein